MATHSNILACRTLSLPCAVDWTGKASKQKAGSSGCLFLSGILVLPCLLTRKSLHSLPRAAANSVTYNGNVVSYGSGSSHPEWSHWVKTKFSRATLPREALGKPPPAPLLVPAGGLWLRLHHCIPGHIALSPSVSSLPLLPSYKDICSCTERPTSKVEENFSSSRTLI